MFHRAGVQPPARGRIELLATEKRIALSAGDFRQQQLAACPVAFPTNVLIKAFEQRGAFPAWQPARVEEELIPWDHASQPIPGGRRQSPEWAHKETRPGRPPLLCPRRPL